MPKIRPIHQSKLDKNYSFEDYNINRSNYYLMMIMSQSKILVERSDIFLARYIGLDIYIYIIFLQYIF